MTLSVREDEAYTAPVTEPAAPEAFGTTLAGTFDRSADAVVGFGNALAATGLGATAGRRPRRGDGSS